MRALILDADLRLSLADRPQPLPAADEALVAIRAAALNRRDYWISKGLYPGLTPPVILGSDGCGEVVALGEGADQSWLGRRVVINPSLAWGASQAHQGADFQILGNPRDGTFASHLAIPLSALHPAPDHLSDAEAAALPLAGLTAWRALVSRAQVRPGERVLITGIGGGVAQMALMLSRSLGCRVAVTSRDGAKGEAARQAGAELALDAQAQDWAKALQGAWGVVDVVIDGVGGANLPALVQAADYGARIVVYGATAGEPQGLPLRPLFWKQLAILGSTMGSPADFADLLDHVREHGLRPRIDGSWPLAEWATALERMASGAACGKLVLLP
ncbi:MAG: alcohol dehydrogenase [Planctomycetota bacterium]|nr:MAG: alcohol dehydrogenase [Planctomycetota bacterium]